jgi:hypothetical protein
VFNEINQVYGVMLKFLKSEHYDMDLKECEETYWIQSSIIRPEGKNNAPIDATEHTFLNKYTTEALIKNHNLWYRDTLSSCMKN